MLRASRVRAPSSGASSQSEHTVTLPREERYRRRKLLATDAGTEFLLDLSEATYLAHGTLLEADDGTLIRVVAASEPVLEIRAGSPQHLARIAWHVGNRHIAAEIAADALYIQPDHVIAEMVRGLGGEIRDTVRPFEPEGGAYGHHGSLHESHHHGDGGSAHAHGRHHHHHHHHDG